MIVHNGTKGIEHKRRVVVLGNFDGIHIGHQNLIKQGIELAKEKNAVLTIFTFYPQ